MKTTAVFFMGFLLFTLAMQCVYAGFDCLDYPDEDLILILDESENNVTYSDYLTSFDLREDWIMLYQGKVSEEGVREYLIASNVVSIADYDDETFLGMYYQEIRPGDIGTIYIIVESFIDYSSAYDIYDKYQKPYRSARNIVNFRDLKEYGVKGFSARFENGDYIIKFIDENNRLIHISGSFEADVQYVADIYSDLKSSLLISETRHWKAKVCKSQTSECTQTIYFSSVYDTYELLECNTVKDGETIPCPKKRIDEYTNSLEIPFPSCEKGDVIEFSYHKDSIFPIRGEFWSPYDFYFERTFPADQLVLELTVPADMAVKYLSTQGLKPNVTQDNGYTTYLWAKEAVDPYKSEDLMPPLREAITLASYTSMRSWDEVKAWAEDMYSDSIEPDAVKDTVDSIVDETDSEDEKIRKIYEWVRDRIRYEDSEIGFLTGYKPHKCGEILSYKFGDCKDHSVLLVSMLEAAGITAYPVLVARDAISMPTPSPYEFYHLIVAVPRGGEYLWLDSTCSWCPYGYLASQEQGVDVLMLLNSGNGFMKTPVHDLDKNRIFEANYAVFLNQEGDAELKISVKNTGSTALALKHVLKDARQEEVKKSVDYMIKGVCSDFKLTDYEILDGGVDGIMLLNLDVECRDVLDRSGEKLVYSIYGESVYADAVETDERRFPIIVENNDFYSFTYEIIPPSGYAVDMLPSEYSEKEHFGSYSFECVEAESKVVCHKEYLSQETVLSPSEFNSFKKFYNEISSLKKSIMFALEKSRPEATKPLDTQHATSTTLEESIPQEEVDESDSVPAETSILLPAGVLLFFALSAFFMLSKRKKKR